MRNKEIILDDWMDSTGYTDEKQLFKKYLLEVLIDIRDQLTELAMDIHIKRVGEEEKDE